MEKLESKHLAPYLPYGLKGISTGIYYTESVETIKGLFVDEILTDCDPVPYDQFQPILRPLSDLTKEIEVNGESFIPIIKFAQLNIDESEWSRLYIETDNKTFFNCMYNTGGDDDDMVVFFDKSGILLTPYERICELLEWHFDVFGLIEKGLAIDINTL